MSGVLIDNSPATYEFSPIIQLDFGGLLKKADNQEFFDFCQRNQEWRIERDQHGEIIVMPPVYSETSGKNFDIAVELGIWARKNKTGRCFESSAGFELPNGAIRSPDVSWIRLERWNALPAEKRQKFAQICPDFVVELRSETDRIKTLQAKMQEYIENGAQLGWLIDPKSKRVHVYRPNVEPEVLENATEVSGEPLLKGFVLSLAEIWS